MKEKIKTFTDTFPELLGIYLILLAMVSVLFSVIEAKPLFDSLWWACATGMTVGYGDIYPATMSGKILAMVWMHVSPLIVVPMIIARLLSHIVEDTHQFSHEEQEQIKSLLTGIEKMLKEARAEEEQTPDSGT
jgi:voltage-gated potassium channel